MEQKIPNIKNRDIKRIIRRDFPHLATTGIEAILKNYKSKSVAGRNRIYAAILKLSNGNIELIKKYIEKANVDYRDIIFLAEYPNYYQCAFEIHLSIKNKDRLINDDWIQYQNWLNKL